MQVNSINQVSFQKNCRQVRPDEDLMNAFESMKSSSLLADSEEKLPKKNPIKTLGSIGLSVALTYGLGKSVGTKAGQIFPGMSEKALELAKKASAKTAQFTTGVIEKLKNQESNKLAQGTAQVIGIAKDYAGKAAGKLFPKGQEVANFAGLVSAGMFVPKILTADGNADGIADICQEGQNAYKTVINGMNTVGTVVSALS